MLVYFLVISIVVILTYVAQKVLNKSKILFAFVSLLILTVPSLLAAFRNDTVGVDVNVYEKSYFTDATQSSSFFEYYETEDSDLFFLAINYVASCFSDSLGAAFFLIEFVFLFFAYLAIYRMRDYSPMWISMLLFMLCYFNLSFNVMRQMVATSFLLFAFTYLLRDNNIKKFFILSIVSFFFHKTAFIGGFFFIYIFWALSTPKSQKTKTVIYVLGCIGIYVLFQILLLLLAGLGGRFEHYIAYGGMDSGANWQPTVVTVFVLGDLMLLCLTVYLYLIKEKENKKEVYVLFMLVVVDLMSQLLGKYTMYANRMSCYFGSPYIFILPKLFLKTNIVNRRTKYVFVSILLLAFVVIWLRMINQTGNTIPYKSDLLGI